MVPDHWSNDAMVSMDRCGLIVIVKWPAGTHNCLACQIILSLREEDGEILHAGNSSSYCTNQHDIRAL